MNKFLRLIIIALVIIEILLAKFSINIPALTINYYGLLLISSFFIYIAILLVLTIKEKYKSGDIIKIIRIS